MTPPLPTFLLAGAPKSGSSAFWAALRQHPDVFAPAQKEPFYFDFNWERGLGWYRAWFEEWAGERAVGEATVWYMRRDGVPERIASVIPDVRLVFLLREPAARAYSNFTHDRRDGRYPFDLGFSKFVRDEALRDGRGIVRAGRYDDHLERFRRHFSDEQMLVVLTDDLRRDPPAVLQRTFEHLGVDPAFAPGAVPQQNVSWGLRRLGVLRGLDVLWRPVGRVTGARSPAQSLWARSRHVRQLFWDRASRPAPLRPEDRAYLEALYRPHVEALARLLGRPLTEWGLPDGPRDPSAPLWSGL